MRRIYIDCGGHKATTAKLILKTHPNFEIHSFEANPEFSKYFENLDVTLHKKAVWINNEPIDFYTAENSQSGSLYKDKETGNIIKNKPLKVDCLDLSEWIISNFKKKDYIILKMNIEGAEYKILEKMMEDGSLSYINELFCQFHYHDIPSMTEKDHNEFVKKIHKKIKKFYHWRHDEPKRQDKLRIIEKRLKIKNYATNIAYKIVTAFANSVYKKLTTYRIINRLRLLFLDKIREKLSEYIHF
ncbi:MAG: FkbM family methyltransferase [Promethearchaeota archaeon]